MRTPEPMIRPSRGRASERGEGMLRLVFFLALLAIAAYLAVQNVPTYFEVQSAKHDLAELCRGSGVVKMKVERVQPQAVRIMNQHALPPSDVKVEQMANGGIQITLNTSKKLNFLVTDYDWHVSEVYSQSPY